MAKTWEAGTCNEKSGFLFSHECFRPARGDCNQCSKPVCEDHSHELMESDGAVICTSCAKNERKHSKSENTTSGSRRSHRYDDHDPYFYGGYYYGSGYYDTYHSSSRHDPHDFTEADAESLSSGSEEGFESDMSES